MPTPGEHTEFWKLVAAYLERSGKTQTQLAKEIGINKNAIQDWRVKGAIPAMKNARKLAKIMGVSVEELIPDASDEQSPFWSEVLSDYLASEAGRDTPPEIRELLRHAPQADFARQLIHGLRQRLEKSRSPKTPLPPAKKRDKG